MRDEFMITRQGKQFVLFAGLLDEAHSLGLKGIDTDLIQVPSAENGDVAIVKATAQMDDERKFSGIGDASPQNVGRNIAPHLIRMAETRAKARALRDAVNVGATAMEELSDGDEGDAPAPQRRQQAVPRNRPAPRQQETDQEAPPPDQVEGVEKGAAKNAKKPDPAKARKSQVDMLKTLAVEWRGENGVERLETRIGKPLAELSRQEANEWIDRLTPEGRE